MTRVPAGAYRQAAIELTAEEGEFDSYELARRVERNNSIEHVSYRSAARWIRKQRNWLVRRRGPIRLPVVEGGRPASYAVVEVILRGAR